MPSKAEQRANTCGDAESKVQEAIDLLEGLLTEIEETRDNMEENFSATERFEAISQACSDLESAKDGLVDAKDTLESELGSIEWSW